MGLFSYSYYTKRDFWHMIKFEPLSEWQNLNNALIKLIILT